MRIIAGEARGRRLRSPRGDTRPFTGRAKESVFAILGERVVGAAVLDLFAGSGSLGLEALSRGAGAATFVEQSRGALEALRANVTAIGLGGEIVPGDVSAYLRACADRFDLVFVDPPFAMAVGDVAGVLEGAAVVLADGGVIVVHRRHGTPLDLEEPTVLKIGDQRRYGDSDVWWLDREKR